MDVPNDKNISATKDLPEFYEYKQKKSNDEKYPISLDVFSFCL